MDVLRNGGIQNHYSLYVVLRMKNLRMCGRTVGLDTTNCLPHATRKVTMPGKAGPLPVPTPNPQGLDRQAR